MLAFSTAFFLKYFSFQEEFSEILSYMYIIFHVKCPLFVKYPRVMKTFPVGAELFHGDTQTDGRTDRRDEAISRFTQFRESA